MSLARLLASLFVFMFALCASRAAHPPLYQEPFRPQFHFTPATNWMNDPNGMVYYEGEYHLFYQYNPFGDKWGHMSWGHAVSPDMVHWQHLPVALLEENEIMIFSGSAVIDWNNTSGFGQNGKPPMIAVYTGHYTKQPRQDQQIAYSNDRGRTWTKYAGNPVLDIGEKDFRDPKVFWHEKSSKWVMVVAWPVERKVRFYSSPNLKEWTHLSDFGPAGSIEGIWECPDLFPLDVEGFGRGKKWTLIVNVGSGGPAGGSACQYFVGDFDGTKFTLDSSYPKPQREFVPAGKVIADFDGQNYGEWKATGEAFGSAPARGTLANQQTVSGFQGPGLVNSFLNGDKTEGTLTSPEFLIDADHLSFLIGGGSNPGKTGMNLLIDGKAVRSVTGPNSERLGWESWDVREFRGKRALLEIIDKHTGGWGHINVDQIMLANKPALPAHQPALWADFGPDFYAAVSWSDVPKSDGRRLWLGWMSNWQYANDVPTSPWRSAMSIPRELSLRKTKEGLRMIQTPVAELGQLRTKRVELDNPTIAQANASLQNMRLEGALWEIELELSSGRDKNEFAVKVLNGASAATVIQCDPARQTMSLDRSRSGNTNFHPAFTGKYKAPLIPNGRNTKLRIFLDTSSVEVFANDGSSIITALVLPESRTFPLELSSSDESLVVKNLKVWKLRPAPAREGR